MQRLFSQSNSCEYFSTVILNARCLTSIKEMMCFEPKSTSSRHTAHCVHNRDEFTHEIFKACLVLMLSQVGQGLSPPKYKSHSSFLSCEKVFAFVI